MPEPITPPPWIEGHSIGTVLRETVREFPDRDAVVFPEFRGSARAGEGVRWTWAELDRRVDQTAPNHRVAARVRKIDASVARSWPAPTDTWAVTTVGSDASTASIAIPIVHRQVVVSHQPSAKAQATTAVSS